MKYLPVPGRDDPIQAQQMSLDSSQRVKTMAAFPHYLWVGQSPSCVKSQQPNSTKQNKPEQKWSCHWHERDTASVSQMTSHGWTLQIQASPSSPHQCCQEQRFPAGVPCFFLQEVNATPVGGWLLGYKCINFLRRCKDKTNTGRCKNLCSLLTEPEHSVTQSCSASSPRWSQTLQGIKWCLFAPSQSFSFPALAPGESKARFSPGLCKVLQLHVLSASGRFK